MHYLRVQWLHSSASDPVEIYSEVDHDGWETRKVEVFRNRTIGYASANESTSSTVLSEERLPSLDEISADPEFRAQQITKEEFEKVWERRLFPAKSA